MENMWEWLGIEPTTDKKIIKRAYAKQTRDCHQEDDPERWKQLHDAYQRALDYVEKGQEPIGRPEHQLRPAETSKMQKLPPIESEKKLKPHFGTKTQKLPPIESQQSSELDVVLINLTEHGEERKQAIYEQLSLQLRQLTSKKLAGDVNTWLEFFQSVQVQQVQLEAGFWEEVYSCIGYGRLKLKVWQALVYEFERIEIEISVQMTAEARKLLSACKKLCIDKVESGHKHKGWRLLFFEAVAVVGVALIVILSAWVQEYFERQRAGANPSQIRENVANYLNEKYDTLEFQADEFEIEEIEEYFLKTRSGEPVGYEITSDVHEELLVYAVFQYREAEDIEAVIYFDNLQAEELEACLEQRVLEATQLETGYLYLLKGYESELAVGIDRMEDGVYHTLLTDDLASFCEEEYTVRKEIEEGLLDPYYTEEEINGRFVLFYPDEYVENMRDRLERGEINYDRAIVPELIQLQREFHMDVIVAGMPQSYYTMLFEKSEIEANMEDTLFRQIAAYDGEYVPFNPAFVSIWYAGEVDEENWVHTPEILQYEDGIYVLLEDASDDVGPLLIERNEGEQEITFSLQAETGQSYGWGDYVIVLDKKALGIGDDYGAIEDDRLDYLKRKYADPNRITMRGCILEGEDFLFMSFLAYSEEDTLVFQWE